MSELGKRLPQQQQANTGMTVDTIDRMTVDAMVEVCMRWLSLTRDEDKDSKAITSRRAVEARVQQLEKSFEETLKAEDNLDAQHVHLEMHELLDLPPIFLNDEYVSVVRDALRRLENRIRATKIFPIIGEMLATDDKEIRQKRRDFLRSTAFNKWLKWLLVNRNFEDIASMMAVLPHPSSLNDQYFEWLQKAIPGSEMTRWEFVDRLAAQGMMESVKDSFYAYASQQQELNDAGAYVPWHELLAQRLRPPQHLPDHAVQLMIWAGRDRRRPRHNIL